MVLGKKASLPSCSITHILEHLLLFVSVGAEKPAGQQATRLFEAIRCFCFLEVDFCLEFNFLKLKDTITACSSIL